jgi:hypothetical protein
MASLLRLNPLLLQRVAYAPRPAIHAMGAFLHLSAEALRPDATIAATLHERDPRDLLRCAIPNAPPKLFRALDRAGDHVRERSFYERLGVLCATPLAETLLSGGPLNDARLHWAEALLSADPAVLQLRAVLAPRTSDIEAIDILVAFLRAHDAFQEDDLGLPNGAGLPAVVRRFQTALDRIEAPSPGFELTTPFRIVRTVRELREAGKLLKNCLSDVRSHGAEHWFRLASGSAVYVVSDAPLMLSVIQQVAPGLWVLESLEGPENDLVEPGTKELLVNAIRSAGVGLVRQTPFRALRSLSSANRLVDFEDSA